MAHRQLRHYGGRCNDCRCNIGPIRRLIGSDDDNVPLVVKPTIDRFLAKVLDGSPGRVPGNALSLDLAQQHAARMDDRRRRTTGHCPGRPRRRAQFLCSVGSNRVVGAGERKLLRKEAGLAF